MALNLVKSPAPVSLVGNDIPFKFWQDKRFSTAAVKASIGLSWNSGDDNEDSFTLKLGGTDVVFNCLTSEDYTGRRYPPIGAESLVEYVESLVPYFQRNYLLHNYVVSYNQANEAIVIDAKEAGSDYTIALTVGTSNINEDYNTAGVTAVERSGYRLFCQTYLKGASEDTLLGEDRLSPDSDANVLFRIQEYLKQQLAFTFTWPEPTDNFLVKNTDCIKQFYVKYGHYYDSTARMLYSTSETTTHVLLGGIDRNMQAVLNEEDKTWFEEFCQNLDWLTNQPRELYISKTQPIKVSALIWQENVTSAKLKIKLTFDDGSHSTITKETQSVNQYNVFDAILSYQKLDLASQSKDVVSYEVWLTDQLDNRLNLSRYYHVDDTYRENERIFIFLNSRGRPDVVRFTGSWENITENTRSSAERIGQDNFTWRNFEKLDYSNFETERIKFNTGHINDLAVRPKQYADYLREFYLSPVVYELVHNRLYPTKLISKKQTINLSDDTLINIEIEAERAYDNNFYSRDENIHPQNWGPAFNEEFLNP